MKCKHNKTRQSTNYHNMCVCGGGGGGGIDESVQSFSEFRILLTWGEYTMVFSQTVYITTFK